MLTIINFHLFPYTHPNFGNTPLENNHQKFHMNIGEKLCSMFDQIQYHIIASKYIYRKH